MSSRSSRKSASKVIEEMVRLTKCWDDLADKKCKEWSQESTPEIARALRESLRWGSCVENLRIHGINACDDDGSTMGHYAARLGDMTFLRYYFDQGGSWDIKSFCGDTIGHDAASYNESDCLKLYLDRGGDIHAKNDDGQTIAYSACWGESTKCLDILHDYGGDIFEYHHRDGNLGHRAAMLGSTACLSWYFRHGGDLTIYDDNMIDIGTHAVKYGKDNSLRIFLDHGGDIFRPGIMHHILSSYVNAWSNTIHQELSRYFTMGGDLPSGEHVDAILKNMLPHLHVGDLADHKCSQPERFEILMRQSFKIDPDGFHIFLAKCSAKAVDGDDRLLQILCNAMESP